MQARLPAEVSIDLVTTAGIGNVDFLDRARSTLPVSPLTLSITPFMFLHSAAATASGKARILARRLHGLTALREAFQTTFCPSVEEELPLTPNITRLFSSPVQVGSGDQTMPGPAGSM